MFPNTQSLQRCAGIVSAASRICTAEEYLPGIFDEARLDRVIDITQVQYMPEEPAYMSGSSRFSVPRRHRL